MRLRHEKDEQSAWQAANAIVGTTAFALFIFSLILSIFPQPFVAVFAPVS